MAALATIAVQIGMKLLGYKFVCKVLIAGAEEWSKSTKTEMDDKVTSALKEALD